MSEASNTTFICYRRSTSNILALAIWQDLHYNDIDAFYDIESLDAGQFDTAILNQIKARPYFLPVLTPGTLERCIEPGDWVLREITEALDLGRIIVPLYTPEFQFDDIDKYLPPKIAFELKRFQAVKIPHEYFRYAMQDVRARFLKPVVLDNLQPTPIADLQAVAHKQELADIQPEVKDIELQAQEYLERGISKRNAGDNEGAILEYDEAIRLNPYDALAHNLRGLAHYT